MRSTPVIALLGSGRCKASQPAKGFAHSASIQAAAAATARAPWVQPALHHTVHHTRHGPNQKASACSPADVALADVLAQHAAEHLQELVRGQGPVRAVGEQPQICWLSVEGGNVWRSLVHLLYN